MTDKKELPKVLDLAQLRRIQGTHGGFLYQHLYAVYCYLAAPSTGVQHVRVERDEDVELSLPGRTVYAQLKYYSSPLSPSDLAGIEERFDALRKAHADGERAGDALFAIVATSGLGPTLAKKNWPEDVLIVTPETAATELTDTGLLPPATNEEELFVRVQELAEGYRLSALRPASLVSKLVGAVARAAAGMGETTFALQALDRFCELVAAQLQPLPLITDYRPQEGEPVLPDEQGHGIVVVGHGGHGKSAWAANMAALSSEATVYVLCSPTTDQDVAARVVQAVLATLVAEEKIRAQEVVLPGRKGTDALSLLNTELVRRSISVTVVLDDCHRASADALTEVVRAAGGIRWCLVGRPSPSITEASALLGLDVHTLSGWDDYTVATALSEAGNNTAPTAVAELRRLTGGAPLFVLRAAEEISDTDGDTASYCQQLTAGGGTRESAQERILERTIAALGSDEIRIAAALSDVDLPLAVADWQKLLSDALDLAPPGVGRILRRLVEQQIVTETVRDRLAVHDAFRPLLRGREVSRSESQTVLRAAAELLHSKLVEERSLDALLPLIRTLATLGKMSQLADTVNAMSDWVRETGSLPEVQGYVELAVASGTLSDDDRFWALDTLAFFHMQDGEADAAEVRIAEMERLASGLGADTKGPVLHKRLLLASHHGDLAAVHAIAQKAEHEPRYRNVIRYHAALGEASFGDVDHAVGELRTLSNEYLNLLGLSPELVLGANPPQLLAQMKEGFDAGDLRHLADCCDAIAKIGRRHEHLRSHSNLYAIWAVKFYGMVGAYRSALVAAQEMVDVILGDLGDPEEALKFMEQTVLPAANHAQLPDLTVPIRAQHAVLLAHCGEFAAAQAAFKRLEPYVPSLPQAGKAEIENQRRLLTTLVARGEPSPAVLAARRAKLAAQHDAANALRRMLPGAAAPQRPTRRRGKKVGRNEPCPCRSGKKYKKCCLSRDR